MDIETIMKAVFFITCIWAFYKCLSLFAGASDNKCDNCGKEMLPFVEKKVVICQHCINHEEHNNE